MRKPFTELEEFKEASSRITKQLRELERDKEKEQKKLEDLDEQYNELIKEEAVTGNRLDKPLLNEITGKKETPNRNIAQINDRINMIKAKEKSLLEELIPGLYDGYKKQMGIYKEEIDRKLDGILPEASKFLKYLSEIGQLNKAADRIHKEFISQTRLIDDTYKDKYRFYEGILNLDYADRLLFGLAPGVGVEERRGLSKNDQINALRHGTFPSSIALFHLTGEIEPKQQIAGQKYRKAKQKQEEINKGDGKKHG